MGLYLEGGSLKRGFCYHEVTKVDPDPRGLGSL